MTRYSDRQISRARMAASSALAVLTTLDWDGYRMGSDQRKRREETVREELKSLAGALGYELVERKDNVTTLAKVRAL